MKEFRIDNKGTGRIFSSTFLEWLTRTRFIVPVLFYYVTSLLCLWIAYADSEISLLKNIWMIPAGMLTFSFVEYIMHRFLFHFNTTTHRQEIVQYSIHGVHHEFPRDKDRLVMPMVISIVLSLGFYFLFKSMMGENGIIFFGGFMAGYSTYLCIHYAVHALKPPNNFLKYWWKHHSLHHYASVHTAFSVSFPLWDIIFGTMPPEGKEKLTAAEKLPDTN